MSYCERSLQQIRYCPTANEAFRHAGLYQDLKSGWETDLSMKILPSSDEWYIVERS